MNSTRILSFTLCLGLACLLVTGSAVAGTTTATEVTYAIEVGEVNLVYTVPGNSITRGMAVLRQAASGNFFLRLTLSGNAEFATASFPVATDLTQTAGTPATNVTITLPSAVVDGDTFVEWSVVVIADFTVFPTFTIDTSTWTIRDVDNVLGGNGTISGTIVTRDANTGLEVDSGTDADDWLVSDVGVEITDALSSTTATIDVATARIEFLPLGGNDADDDNGATVGIDNSVATVLEEGGGAYTLVTADTIDLVVTGDLSGISRITYALGGAPPIVLFVSPADVTAMSATLSIPGDHAAFGIGPITIQTKVDGVSTLSPRTLTITINLTLSGGAGGPAANSREISAPTTLTVWSLNGTVLIAGFMNGNTNLFSSRVYLWNSSSNAGDIVVRVYTLPLSGASTLLATENLGSLPGTSGRNIRLDPDLAVIGLPYLADGGNLVFEITVEASNVTGNGQVFQLDLSSFGIYTLEVIN